MDKIKIKGIHFHGYHGVYSAEREIGQKYEVDLKLSFDLSTAGKSDVLAETIDYSKIVDIVLKTGTKQSFHLFEALAESIATQILGQTAALKIQVEVKKLSPPIDSPINYAGVKIKRKRNKITKSKQKNDVTHTSKL